MERTDFFHGENLRNRAKMFLGCVPEGSEETIRQEIYEYLKDKDLLEALEFLFAKPWEHFNAKEKKEAIDRHVEAEGYPIKLSLLIRWCFEMGIDPEDGSRRS